MSTMTKAANKVDRHFLSDMWLSETGLTCKATNLSCRTGVSEVGATYQEQTDHYF
jgi:hypothetical protein